MGDGQRVGGMNPLQAHTSGRSWEVNQSSGLGLADP
jgi:hypothetical protein